MAPVGHHNRRLFNIDHLDFRRAGPHPSGPLSLTQRRSLASADVAFGQEVLHAFDPIHLLVFIESLFFKSFFGPLRLQGLLLPAHHKVPLSLVGTLEIGVDVALGGGTFSLACVALVHEVEFMGKLLLLLVDHIRGKFQVEVWSRIINWD